MKSLKGVSKWEPVMKNSDKAEGTLPLSGDGRLRWWGAETRSTEPAQEAPGSLILGEEEAQSKREQPHGTKQCGFE